MTDATLAPLAGWENFYVIVGSSSAALTGLQFVVIALVAEVRQESSTRTIDTFATPTVVHFCVALLISATLSASIAPLRTALRNVGLDRKRRSQQLSAKNRTRR